MKSGIRLIDPTLRDIVLQDSQAAADDVCSRREDALSHQRVSSQQEEVQNEEGWLIECTVVDEVGTVVLKLGSKQKGQSYMYIMPGTLPRFVSEDKQWNMFDSFKVMLVFLYIVSCFEMIVICVCAVFILQGSRYVEVC